MRSYLFIIKQFQQILLGFSIAILAILPTVLVMYPSVLNFKLLYAAAHASLFLVMIVRPLADLLPTWKHVRPLVILRKGMGSFSASIIVAFILAKLIVDPSGYLASFGTTAYWSLEKLALFAHLADISAIALLVTSNNFSKRILGPSWKRLQRLSYVYFYGSAIYVFFIFEDNVVLLYMIVVTTLTLTAYLVNRARRNKKLSSNFTPNSVTL